LYGWQGRDVYKLRMFENRMPRETELLRCKREEFSESSRKLDSNFVTYTPQKLLY
jgi:hypothetical protein